MSIHIESAESAKRKKVRLSSVKYAFRTIIWPRKKLLFIGLLLIFINRLAGLVLPGSSKFIFDRVIPEEDYGLLRVILFAVGGAVLIQAVSSFILTRLLSVEAQRLIAALRGKMQRHIVRMSLHFFDNNQAGALVSRVMSDVEGVRNLVGTGVVYMVGGLLTAAVSLGILFSINAILTGVSLIPLLLFGVISYKAFSYIRPIYRKRWGLNSEVTGRLTESFSGIRVIKGFHAEERESGVFEEGADRIFQNVKSTLTATSLVNSLGAFLLGAASIAIMGIGAVLIIRGEMQTGDLVAFSLYMGFLITPIFQMGNIGSQITESFAGLDRMEEILSLEREGEEPGRTIIPDSIEGLIEFDDVHFSYEDEGEKVLSDISYTARPGTVTALVGSSGSGKSTIAGLAASFYIPDQGTVSIDGHDLKTVNLESYRKNLGVVLQDDFLFDGTIRENILFADPEADEKRLTEAVGAANVNEFTDRFDEGLDTMIGERGVKLSGGQRQRISIARALLADPRILILDEATSNLDTMSERLIQESLEYLMKGRTTLIIAHRLSTIRKADQILVIQDGRISEQGTHEQLIKAEGHYHQLYTYQARI